MSVLNPLCIYHDNCADGFAGAWVVRKAWQERVTFGEGVEFFGGRYGNQQPPDVTGRFVIMVDFSYKREQLLEMAAKAHEIVILDHHKTAKDDLVDLPRNVYCTFDMNRSGAMIAWDHFYPGQKPPRLIEVIQDRDLWLFKIEGTREIQASVFSFAYDFEVWDKLMETDVEILRSEGAAIERKHQKDVAEIVGVVKRRMRIGGHDVPVANMPYMMASDGGHVMGVGEPFAATYYDSHTGRHFSLRSAADGVDVSDVAKQLGKQFGTSGGGHAHAAGFLAPAGWEGEVHE